MTLTVKDDAGLTNTTTGSVTVAKRPTTTTYLGDTTGDYHDGVTLRAMLEDTATGDPLAVEDDLVHARLAVLLRRDERRRRRPRAP